MKNQMCWLFPQENSNRMILHLREHSDRGWRPYTAYPQYFVPDYKVPGGSKGWATYQRLRKIGWTLIATDRAYIDNEKALVNSRNS